MRLRNGVTDPTMLSVIRSMCFLTWSQLVSLNFHPEHPIALNKNFVWEQWGPDPYWGRAPSPSAPITIPEFRQVFVYFFQPVYRLVLSDAMCVLRGEMRWWRGGTWCYWWSVTVCVCVCDGTYYKAVWPNRHHHNRRLSCELCSVMVDWRRDLNTTDRHRHRPPRSLVTLVMHDPR